MTSATFQSMGDDPMTSGSLVTFIPQSDSICSARLGLLELRHFAKILDFSVAISCPNPVCGSAALDSMASVCNPNQTLPAEN